MKWFEYDEYLVLNNFYLFFSTNVIKANPSDQNPHPLENSGSPRTPSIIGIDKLSNLKLFNCSRILYSFTDNLGSFIGYTSDIKKRVNVYKVGNFKHKLLAYIPLQIDKKAIEQCVKSKLKLHLTKLITDTVCYISLTELKNEIIDCINLTNLTYLSLC